MPLSNFGKVSKRKLSELAAVNAISRKFAAARA
jgi:hypothetical protein